MNDIWIFDLCNLLMNSDSDVTDCFHQHLQRSSLPSRWTKIFSRIKWTTWEFPYSDFIFLCLERNSSVTRILSRNKRERQRSCEIHIINNHLLIIYQTHIYIGPWHGGFIWTCNTRFFFPLKCVHVVIDCN